MVRNPSGAALPVTSLKEAIVVDVTRCARKMQPESTRAHCIVTRRGSAVIPAVPAGRDAVQASRFRGRGTALSRRHPQLPFHGGAMSPPGSPAADVTERKQ